MKIDEEVKKMVVDAYDTAREILESNREPLVWLAEALLEFETLNREQIEAAISGQKIRTSEEKIVPPAEPESEPEEETEEKGSLPSLVNPKERPAPA